MKWAPRGFGGERRPPEHIKREGWQAQRVLVIEADDERLTWPERELVRQLAKWIEKTLRGFNSKTASRQ